MISGQKGNHGLWVKCSTSAECLKTDISVVLAVMSGQGVRLGIDYGNGKWYSFRLERSTFGLITWVNSKTRLSL
jgi:hypothetical protein